jgi:hypothetical protein
MRLSSFFLIFAAVALAQEPTQQLSSASDVVARMMEHDSQRQSALHSYTASRRYVLENPRHRKRAEMLVSMTCRDNGSKQFQTVSATGWSVARNHVFPGLLEGESEAYRPDIRERSRITPNNYSFVLLGMDDINQRAAYVLAISPKTRNKYLVEGKLWVDAEEYAIVRIEGKPAKNPSFWIKSVHFVHTYQKSGPFWLPASDRSVSDARILGATELTIEYFDYALDADTLAAFREAAPGARP